MVNVDYKKKYKELFAPSAKKFSIVDVPKLAYLMLDGRGDPNSSQEYQNAVEALYSVSYTLRFNIKKSKDFTYTVPPLEGLWWADDMENFARLSKEEWYWTMMILLPEMADSALVDSAIEAARKKKALPSLGKLRFEIYEEGLSAQILYFGAYADEGPTIVKLHEFIESEGYRLSGKHHEIYLGDPRKTAPEKLKTVIRQPMAK